MNSRTNESSLWGTYAPRGINYLILLMKNLGLGYGASKKLLGHLWRTPNYDTPVDIIYHGLKFRLYPWDNSIEGKILFGHKRRDRKELEAAREFVSSGGVFIDIGANIGYYSLMAAAFGAQRVFAVEPNPKVYSRLVFNVSANSLSDRVMALPIALGEQDGRANLFIENNDMGGSKIGDIEIPGTSVTVPIKPLAQLLAEEEVDRIDALKIDVEGMEDSVLFPFYENTPTSMWPRLVIIEHINGQQWKRNILSHLSTIGYEVIGKTRSNTILRLIRSYAPSPA